MSTVSRPRTLTFAAFISAKCEFCEIPFIWQQGVQRRPIDHIIAEMIHLRDAFGIRRVEILDDLFVSNRRWTREFCQALVREKVDMQWSCFGYISLMTEEPDAETQRMVDELRVPKGESVLASTH